MTRTWPQSWTPARASNLDELLGEFFVRPQASNGKSAWGPRVDVLETPEAYLLRAELPGIDPKTVEITLQERTLTLSGEKVAEANAEGERSHVSERAHGAFKRSFTFPELVDADAVSAKAEHGLLTIEVRKVPEVQPKKITIQSD